MIDASNAFLGAFAIVIGTLFAVNGAFAKLTLLVISLPLLILFLCLFVLIALFVICLYLGLVPVVLVTIAHIHLDVSWVGSGHYSVRLDLALIHILYSRVHYAVRRKPKLRATVGMRGLTSPVQFDSCANNW
jgi:hypothetical protein